MSCLVAWLLCSLMVSAVLNSAWIPNQRRRQCSPGSSACENFLALLFNRSASDVYLFFITWKKMLLGVRLAHANWSCWLPMGRELQSINRVAR